MYWRFTDRARKVLKLANAEAQRLGNTYLRNEHVLLGIVKERTGIGATILGSLGITENSIDDAMAGGLLPALGEPSRPLLKQLIDQAIQEAKALGHAHVGTEHLLLALTRDPESIAGRILLGMNVTLLQIRTEVMRLLGREPKEFEQVELTPGGSTNEGIQLLATADLHVPRAPLAETRVPDIRQPRGMLVLEWQLTYLQLIVALLWGSGCGFLIDWWVGLYAGLLVGFVVFWIGNTSLAMFTGAISGVCAAIALVGPEPVSTLPFIAGFIGILVGIGVGDWRKDEKG